MCAFYHELMNTNKTAMNHSISSDSMGLKEWMPLLGLTASAFLVNTSEYIPIGLLSGIAADFHLTEAGAGLLISSYALAVMLLSLPLMLLASRIEQKRLLIGTLSVFAAFQVLSAAAASFPLLILARLGVACAHAVFWSIASPLAVKLVPDSRRSLAISMVATGTSIAMIAGMPIGRMIGLAAGWRMTFVSMGAASALVTVFLLAVFPRMANGGAFSLRELPGLLKSRALMSLYCFTVLIVTAYYMSYSYIEPFLQQTAGLSAEAVTRVLMLYGVAGLFGSFLYARCFRRAPLRFITATVLSMTAVLFLLRPASENVVFIVLLCAFWGIVVTAFNVTFQGETIHCAPEGASAIAMSIYSGLYNLGISLGSEFGAMVTTHLSIDAIGYVGGILAVFASAYCLLRFTKLLGTYD